jgi:hypothetical protein
LQVGAPARKISAFTDAVRGFYWSDSVFQHFLVNMEEGWKAKPVANNTRPALVLYIRQWVKALVSYARDAEAFLRKSVLTGHVEKGFSDHERRKYKHSKLKHIISPLRPGRMGYVLILFSVIGMLAFVSHDTSLQLVEEDFERVIATQANIERYGKAQS